MCFQRIGHLQITDIPPKAIKEILWGLSLRVKLKLPIGYIRESGLFSVCSGAGMDRPKPQQIYTSYWLPLKADEDVTIV